MADLYPNLQFPRVDWAGMGESLANLPNAFEEGRLRQLRRSLGNIDATDVNQLKRAGGRLISGGDLEGGLKFLEQARKIEESAALPPLLARQLAGSVNITPSETPAINIRPVTPSPAPQTPEDTRFGPTAPGALQQVIGPQSQVLPPTPEERGPMLAQVGSDLPPVGVPQGTALPSWMQGARATPDVAPPPRALQSQPQIQSSITPQLTDTERSVQENVRRYTANLFDPRLSLRQRAEAFKILRPQIDSELARLKIDPAEREYQRDYIERQALGEPTISRDEFTALKDTRKERFTEAVNTYKPIAENWRTAEAARSGLLQMKDIAYNEKFISGPGAATIHEVTGWINTARNTIKALTGSDPTINGTPLNEVLNKTKDIGALMDVFRALSNKGVLADLGGSLGKQISDGDRLYLGQANPGLALTKAGNQALIEIKLALNEHQIKLGREIAKYREERGVSKTTGYGIDLAVDDFAKRNPVFSDDNGNLTPAGRKIQSLLNTAKQELVTTQQVQSAAPTAVPSQLPGGLKQGSMLRDIGRFQPPGPPTQADFSIPPMAKGGPVKAGKPYEVGEKGPETFVPEHRRIMPHHEGKVYYEAKSGKPMGRIKNGKCVPFRGMK